MTQLNHTLLSKSEQYSDVALKAIFRLNNNNYVLKSLQRSKLLELYIIAEPRCEQIYYDFIQKDKKAYFQRFDDQFDHSRFTQITVAVGINSWPIFGQMTDPLI